MATHFPITSVSAGHSLLSTIAILPVEDAFTDTLDWSNRAVELEKALDHRHFGDTSHRISFAFADAAWARAFALLDLVIALEPVTPLCCALQEVAWLMRDAMVEQEDGAIRAVAGGDASRDLVRPMSGTDAASRRARMLTEHALGILAAQLPVLEATLVEPVLQLARAVPSVPEPA
ncbi:hypothetical protein ACXN5S_17930 [Pseudoroseicyclus sp. H15]